MYNDFWLMDKGLRHRKSYGDLRDIIARRMEDQEVEFVKKEDTIAMAYAKIKLHHISQLPVLEESELVGIIDETDILFAKDMQAKVEKVMAKNLVKVKPNAPLSELVFILKGGMVVIVEDEQGHFCGMITKTDLIPHLPHDK